MSLIHSVAKRTPIRAARARVERLQSILFTIPRYPGLRMTWKRRLNLYRARVQTWRADTVLHAYPIALTIEATNVCNLRCPFCFTGAGEVGRERSMLQMPLYEKMLGELGDRLLRIEFYNWGEPLLNKNIEEMISMASRRGISTLISTNFSIPFDEARAEKLVRSGLATLGLSIDGATQETYEQYRVRGDLSRILANIRLINDAKRRLRSSSPHVVWEYHVFPWNHHEIEQARAMADELGVELAVSKGWVAGTNWNPEGEYDTNAQFPMPCYFLWQAAVIHNDGGVAPCCGTFYREDDFGSVSNGSANANGNGKSSTNGNGAANGNGNAHGVRLSELEGKSFREVWNNERFRKARAMFAKRADPDAGKDIICHACPVTHRWRAYLDHQASGSTEPFHWLTIDDGFNFFWENRPQREGAVPATADDLIPLAEISAPKA